MAEDLIDIVIAGGGPAGLAAALYGARSGMGTVVLESMLPGGQAALTETIQVSKRFTSVTMEIVYIFKKGNQLLFESRIFI